VEQIKSPRKAVDESYIESDDPIELAALHEMVNMLQLRFKALDDIREAYKVKLNNPYLKAVKRTMAFVEGGLVMASGFFAGQSLAVAIAGFFVSSVALTFWPILVASVVFSLAALGVYCVMQRPTDENRVGHLLGYDKDQIESFADSSVINKQKKKLQLLENKIVDKLQSQQHIAQLYKKIGGVESGVKPSQSVLIDQVTKDQKSTALGLHVFFKRSHSMNDLLGKLTQEASCPLI